MSCIDNIVFSSGGMGGIVYVGVIRSLEEKKFVPKGISGCSIGAIFALLYSIGYSSEELYDIVMTFDIYRFLDINILDFFESYGIDTGSKLMKFLSSLIYRKLLVNDLTFAQHFQITGKKLWINTSSIKDNKAYYYSVDTSPNMSVIRAVRRSISIPFIFTADQKNFIDGAYHDPVPSKMFKKNTLCIIIQNSTNTSDSFLGFCNKLIDNKSEKKIFDSSCIIIDTGINTFNFVIPTKIKNRIIKLGYIKTINAI
jgi:NTE family protein